MLPYIVGLGIRDYAKSNYEKPESEVDSVVLELDEMWHYLSSKTQIRIWKAYCCDTSQLIYRECGMRDGGTFAKLFDRLLAWNAHIYFSDNRSTYREFIPLPMLVQTKSQTHLIESNNMLQRHWFGQFRRKTRIVSHSLEMIDLTVMLYAKFHVNGKFDYNSICL
jgi:insertion element IS1 protein InsB